MFEVRCYQLGNTSLVSKQTWCLGKSSTTQPGSLQIRCCQLGSMSLVCTAASGWAWHRHTQQDMQPPVSLLLDSTIQMSMLS